MSLEKEKLINKEAILKTTLFISVYTITFAMKRLIVQNKRALWIWNKLKSR